MPIVGVREADAASWTKPDLIRIPAAGTPGVEGPPRVDAALQRNGAGVVAFANRRGRLFVARNGGPGRRFAPARRVFPKVSVPSVAWDLDVSDRGLLGLVSGRPAASGIEGALQPAPGRFSGGRRLDQGPEGYGPPVIALAGNGRLVTGFTGEREGTRSTYATEGRVQGNAFLEASTLDSVPAGDGDEGFAAPEDEGPAAPQLGISDRGDAVVAWRRADGAIGTASKRPSSPWKLLPPVAPVAQVEKLECAPPKEDPFGKPECTMVRDVEAAEFALDVAQGGRAALAWEQDGTIIVQELRPRANAWGRAQVVATGQASEPFVGPGGGAYNPDVTGVDVATGAGGGVAVAWGTSGAFEDNTYRIAVRRRGSRWPKPTVRLDPATPALERASYGIDSLFVEMDGRNNAVAVFTHGGGSGGEGNPILATTSSSAGAWSPLQDLGRFFDCDTFLPPEGPPSLDGSARRGVLVAWACTPEPSDRQGPGIVAARTFG